MCKVRVAFAADAVAVAVEVMRVIDADVDAVADVGAVEVDARAAASGDGVRTARSRVEEALAGDEADESHEPEELTGFNPTPGFRLERVGEL